MSFLRVPRPCADPTPDSRVRLFLFRQNELLIVPGATSQVPRWEFARMQAETERARYLGQFDGEPCYAAAWPRAALPPGLEARELRSLFGQLDETSHQVAGLAVHLLHWDRTHSFCGACGAPTIDSNEETAKRCPRCDLLAYPRIAPAVIVAVVKDDELLLARAVRFKLPFFSVLAGFVEPGETLEQCVKREIREEVGLEVQDVRYFGSQPWPFPDSLMVAFTARYASGELVLDPKEIAEAGWYRREKLPPLPGSYSIAKKLIDWFVETRPAA